VSDLTSDPNAATLTETEVMGRTVYVGEDSQTAYVEFQDELVSMTNLRAWNHLMEQAKIKEIDGYDTEETLRDKELARAVEDVASTMSAMGAELQREAGVIRGKVNDE